MCLKEQIKLTSRKEDLIEELAGVLKICLSNGVYRKYIYIYTLLLQNGEHVSKYYTAYAIKDNAFTNGSKPSVKSIEPLLILLPAVIQNAGECCVVDTIIDG